MLTVMAAFAAAHYLANSNALPTFAALKNIVKKYPN